MYLLRAGAELSDSCIRIRSEPQELVVDEAVREHVKAFLITGEPRAPRWLDDLGGIVQIDRESASFESTSVGAVVLISVGDRVLAATFGVGFHAIEPRLVERGFGLRVAANLVASDRIRGAQTRGIARHSRDQKTILPTDGAFNDLAVEVDEDWLRQLAGRSSNPDVATSISGSDSLRITAPDFTLKQVRHKASEVLDVYRAQDYKQKFPFLDQVVPLDRSDPAIERLNALAASQLRSEEPRLAFAPPDPFEHSALDHYELTANYHRHALDDLDNDAVFAVVRTVGRLTSPLTGVQVYAVDGDGAVIDRHELRAYLQTEVELDGTQYLLSAGQWFEVNRDFVGQIERQMSSIDDITDTLDLPVWDAAALKSDRSDPTPEGSYNKSLAALRGWALLDKDLVHFGPHEKLELADIVTPDGQLLCVKAVTKSPVLSHLVAQAIDSSAAWNAREYEAMLSTAWAELGHLASLERRDAVFVLAIATPKEGPLSLTLFFFSKVLIARCRAVIERAGFRLAIARIPMATAQATEVPRKRRIARRK
jgi:uncharacterized protein (TIGR04141 family)